MRKKNTVLWFVVVLIAVVVVVAWKFAGSSKSKPTATAAVPVKVVKVIREDVPLTVSGIGSVLSQRSVIIRPQVEGILTRLLVKEGQHVEKGQLLATIDDRSIRAALDQARAQLAQNQAQLVSAQANLKRYKLLIVDNGVSRQTLDDQQGQVDQLKAGLLGAQAAIAAAQVQLSYTQIHSPVSGRVGIRTVDEGNFLRVADTDGLFSVTQIDPISVEFSLPQQLLPTLQQLVHGSPPAKVEASVGNPAEPTPPLAEGSLTLIDNQVSSTTGTLRAKADFANPAEKLWPGQLVNIKIQTGLRRDALVVPPTVVQRGLDNYFVYRIKPGGDHEPSVEVVKVQVAYQNSELDVITGVNEGDVLVSDGQSRLKPGVRAHIITKPDVLAEQPDSDEPVVEARP